MRRVRARSNHGVKSKKKTKRVDMQDDFIASEKKKKKRKKAPFDICMINNEPFRMVENL